MSLDAEVLILGGGCSGLSLATALAHYTPHLRVLTLEQRPCYTRDRTWCFWNTTDHPFRAGVTHAWHQWRVQAHGTEVRQQSTRLCYQHLPADRFYGIAQECIARANQELLFNTCAQTIRGTQGSFQTETNLGVVRSRWVFDARTPPAGDAGASLLQRFEGWHVRTERPCFNPHCVDLMDFQSGEVEGRAIFFYVLPFTEREALIEVTYLDAPGLPPEHAADRLRRRMAQLCPAHDFDVVYRETGTLPMGTYPSAAADATAAVRIGTRGGRIKPSSGYAFQRIQRQSEVFAKALAQGEPLPGHIEPRYYDWLDRVFLTALQRHPARTADYFLALFRRVQPDALVPFLSETAGIADLLSTMWALPTRDFAQAAAASTFGALAWPR